MVGISDFFFSKAAGQVVLLGCRLNFWVVYLDGILSMGLQDEVFLFVTFVVHVPCFFVFSTITEAQLN